MVTRSHRILLVITALLAGFAVSESEGGVSVYSMDLFNNTHQVIHLVPRKGRTVEIEPGVHQMLPYSGEIVIRTDNALLHFDPVEAPAAFVRKGLLSKTIRAQFSSDDQIWLVPLAIDFPMLNPVQQPSGFPLRPH